MIKTAINIVVVALLIWGAYALWTKYESYSEQEQLRKQAENAVKDPEKLPGMPAGLEDSYKTADADAQGGNVAALRNWLKMHGQSVQDPRRAWIELDYMVYVSKTDPQEAKKIFADVKGRITEDSPVYPRIKQLEKTYE